jgi:hypothetical protein
MASGVVALQQRCREKEAAAGAVLVAAMEAG